MGFTDNKKKVESSCSIFIVNYGYSMVSIMQLKQLGLWLCLMKGQKLIADLYQDANSSLLHES